MVKIANRHRSGWLKSAALSFAVFRLVGVADGQCEYTVLHTVPLGPICGNNTYTPSIEAIADNGTVCGGVRAGTSCPERPFIWHPGDPAITFLPLPAGAVTARAVDLNETDLVVGFYRQTDGGPPLPCAWMNGTASQLSVPSQATAGEALAVNDDGSIVGYWLNHRFGPGHAARWDGRAFTFSDIHPDQRWAYSVATDISDSGIVVGRIDTGTTSSIRAFVRTNAGTSILPPIAGGISSEAIAINNVGDVVGIGYLALPGDPAFTRRSFLWRDGVMIDLGVLGGLRDCLVSGIDDDGQAVGGCLIGGPTRGFVWKAGKLSTIVSLGSPLGETIDATNNAGHLAFRRTVLESEPRPPYDIDQNCSVNVLDLLAVINAWGMSGVPADCTQDGIVNSQDLILVLLNWGQ